MMYDKTKTHTDIQISTRIAVSFKIHINNPVYYIHYSSVILLYAAHYIGVFC